MKKTLISTFFTLAILGFFVGVVLPVLWLGYYNHPSVGDDYCFAYMTRDYGFWEAQNFYYNGWSGRFFGNMIFHATPLSWGNYTFVKILPWVILALMLHANYFLWKYLFPAFNTRIHLGMTLLFNALYIASMPSWIDTFYWYSAVFIYPTTMAYWQYFIAYLLRYYQANESTNKILMGVFVATVMVFTIGSNEMMMLFMLSFVSILFGYQLLFQRKFNLFFLVLLLVALASAAVVLLAPGNAVRMNGGGLMEAGIGRAINATLHSFVSECGHWLFLSPLLPFSLLFGYFLKKYEGTFHPIFKIPLWVALVGWLGLTMLMFFAIHYGNNMGLPARVTNIIYEFFVFGWLYNVTLWQVKWDIFGKLFKNLQKPVLYMVSILLMGITFVTSNNLKVGYKELLRGTAKGYDQEMKDRYELIRTAKSDTIYVPTLKNQPTMLYFDEIKNNEKHLWNKCYAQYFEKKVIILK